LELHIEQGNTLEKEQKKIGIVTGIVGLERYQVTMMGKSNHAGTTMMEYREDAVTAAARFIAAMDEKTREIGDHLVCTFSRFTITPNVLAVINREVTMVLECRNQKKERMEELASEAKRFLSGQKAKMEPLVKKDPVDCHPAIVEQMEQVCIKQNISYRKMPSGATHDGNCFAKKMPIGMLFIPSIGGVSHCREEESAWEDVMQGISVLHDTVLRLAAEEEDGRCWI
jgi:hydantoinase/carbamoylase family amidase